MLWILVLFTSISVTLGKKGKGGTGGKAHESISYSPEGCMDAEYNGSTCTIACHVKDACNFKSIKVPQAIDTLIIRCAPKQPGHSTCKDELRLGNQQVTVYVICFNDGCKDINGLDRNRFPYVYCEPAKKEPENCKDVTNKNAKVEVGDGIKAWP